MTISSTLRKAQTLPTKVVRRLRHYYDFSLWERLLTERLLPPVIRVLYPPRQRQRPNPSDVKSVLVWNIDSLGDSIWITPSLRALRAGYPQAKITLICNRVCNDLVQHNPHVDEILPIDPKPYYQGKGWLRFVPELRNRHFDVMVVLEMGSRPADAGRLMGRRLDVGFLVSSHLGILKSLPDVTLPPNAQEYWPAYFMKAVEALGLTPAPIRLEILTTHEDDAAVSHILNARNWSDESDGVARIGFHPCVAAYGSRTKQWPLENFVALARQIVAERPARFLITGSRDESGPCESLAQAIRETTGAEVLSTAGLFKVREIVALYKKLDALVVGDTAALHFAMAAQTPTVAIFGATNPETIAPHSPLCKTLTTPLPCRPCHQNRDRLPFWPTCLFDEPKCLLEISPERVARELTSLLPSQSPSASSLPNT